MNRTHDALAGISRAVRNASLDIEGELEQHALRDLPTPVLDALAAATESLTALLANAEGYGPDS
ncbi:MAG: hypothetical protein QOK04_2370 [Solirubrobacteraceae bacterium]|jgi:hypothetical protein|nr:hypothetical protein [Solirubrobacteraceae bacterium]